METEQRIERLRAALFTACDKCRRGQVEDCTNCVAAVAVADEKAEAARQLTPSKGTESNVHKAEQSIIKKNTVYVIDYGCGTAFLMTDSPDWRDRFYVLASDCFGIRKSIFCADLVKKFEVEYERMPGEVERLEHDGNCVVFGKDEEKILTEFESNPEACRLSDGLAESIKSVCKTFSMMGGAK